MNKNRIIITIALPVILGVICYTLYTDNSAQEKEPAVGPKGSDSSSSILAINVISAEEKSHFQNRYLRFFDESLERLLPNDEARRVKLREKSKVEILDGLVLSKTENCSDDKFRVYQKYLATNISWVLDHGKRYKMGEETQDQILIDLIRVFLRRKPLKPEDIQSINHLRLSLRENAIGKLKEVFAEFIKINGVEYFESETEGFQILSIPVDDYFTIESALLYSSLMDAQIPSDWPKIDNTRVSRASLFLQKSQKEEQKESPNKAVVINERNMYRAIMTLELIEQCRNLPLRTLQPSAPDLDQISQTFFEGLDKESITDVLILRSKLPSRM
ncbi:hypothetical protein BVX99_02860 [bacterium F16]|nr:hypothetical protein BVX99_02860 [bacterium F16]